VIDRPSIFSVDCGCISKDWTRSDVLENIPILEKQAAVTSFLSFLLLFAPVKDVGGEQKEKRERRNREWIHDSLFSHYGPAQHKYL
jgi:hypothetical protein